VDSLEDNARSGSEWSAAPPTFAAAAEEVHAWRFRLDPPDDSVKRLEVTLADDERARAQRFYFERHRRRFIVGRGTLRAILGRYLHQKPESLRFGYGMHGKPAVEGSGDLHFNLSHSAEAGLLGVARGREIGVDLEQVRPREHLDELAQRFFAPSEVTDLEAVEAAAREQAFFNCWTRKEAFLKAGGEGLARPLDQFSVTLRPGEPARLLAVAGDPEEAARWALRTLTPWPGFVACVARRDHGWILRCWDGQIGTEL